jgi:UDP-N-acetylglucosamine--N-acetylmuramyl-(pentapeptide) pyrophosphoryl-undecaprenol N-acetylglucosamine transferase
MEKNLVERLDIPFRGIPAAGVHGVGLRSLPGNLWRLWRGYRAARQILAEFRPQVLFFTGGYVGVPVALAARTMKHACGRPSILLYVPDIEPGLALKTLARFADQIAITAPDSAAFFDRNMKTTVSGYPVRTDLKRMDKKSARKVFGLKDDLPILLVFGGSLGARSINRALMAALPTLLEQMQVIHICGNLDWEEVGARRVELESIYPQFVERYRVYAYLHEEMGAAFCAADLAVCRAGASTLGELPAMGLPAVLVPYPFSWRYQKVNAAYLEKHGAALILADEDLPALLTETITSLLRDHARRDKMAKAMKGLDKPDAASVIAEVIRNLAMAGATTPAEVKAW